MSHRTRPTVRPIYRPAHKPTVLIAIALVAAGVTPWLTSAASRAASSSGAAQADPVPGPAPRIALTGVGRGFAGNVGRPADGHGDDGDLARGRLPALEHAAVLTPTTQADNIVRDRRTGRMWIRRLDLLDGTDGVGAQGNVRLDRPVDWQMALDTAKALRYAGFDDWRLPTVHELDSLVDFGHSEPALDPHAFPQAYDRLPSSYFWSSTTSPAVAWLAFYVNVRDGHRYPWNKASLFAVRPVRMTDPSAMDGAGGDSGSAQEGSAPRTDVAILRTGQAAGYVGNRGGTGTGNGDDGDLMPGEEAAYDWADDGTIDTPTENLARDLLTGLTWIRNPDLVDGSGGSGGNVDLSTTLDWQTAVDRCAALHYADSVDWRLPNIRELDSIMLPGRSGAPVLEEVFAPAAASGDPERPPSWWSSTTATFPHPDQRPADGAWYVDDVVPARRHYVSPGNPPAKGRPRSVRCVRDDGPKESGGTGDPSDGGRETGAPTAPSWLPVVRGSTGVSTLAIETGPGRFEIKWLMAADATLDWAYDDGGIGHAGSAEPHEDAPPFAAAFQDTRQSMLHLDFLARTFPERYGGLGTAGYEALVGRRATRALYAGTVAGTRDRQDGWTWGWDVAVADDPSEALTRPETIELHRRLARVFRRRPLAYAPRDPLRLATALAWSDRWLPVAGPVAAGATDYEAYTPGITYGTVRLFDRESLALAADAGALGRHDIVVVTDGAPADLEQVVAGMVTAAPQGALSHLAVRAARRGSPNAFDRAAAAVFAPWAGQLVRLLVGAEGIDLSAVEPAEAAAWWAARRPPPVPIAAADMAPRAIVDLAALGALDAGEGEEQADEDPLPKGEGVTRYGGKATNLARLYRFLAPERQVPGLALPFAYFADHMGLPAGPTGPADTSLEAWVASLAADPAMADGQTRAARLAALREAIRDVDEDEALIIELAARIDDTFGPHVMVRFRSSSNAEDGLRFNGAGLYDSTSVCVADSLDADKDGPSRCDPAQAKERTIQRGLRKVWAGLYSLRAWEEREWYGIAQTEAAMAILITPAFPDERANGVAFTGDPAQPEAPWMLVSAQEGDTSVVAPEPGTLPERSALLVGRGGGAGQGEDGTDDRITGIRRIQGSSLLPAGEHVLNDPELLALGALLLEARARFPVDHHEREEGAEAAPREELLLDLEFKLRRGDDALLIKQIRPFLPSVPETGLLLVAPEALSLCGMWRVADPIEVEHAGHVEVDLAPAELRLRWEEGGLAIPEDWIAALRWGGDRVAATPLGPTQAQTNTIAGRDDLVGLALHRVFADPAGGPDHEVVLTLPALPRDRLSVRVLDAASSTEPHDLAIALSLPDGGRRLLGPCGLRTLPAETIHVWASLQSADVPPIPLRLRLDLRKADAPLAPYQWADLVGAELHVGDQRTRVSDLARLTYDAGRHNWDERLWIDLDPPMPWIVEDTESYADLARIALTLPSSTEPQPRLALFDTRGAIITPRITFWLRQRSVEGASSLRLPWLGR